MLACTPACTPAHPGWARVRFSFFIFFVSRERFYLENFFLGGGHRFRCLPPSTCDADADGGCGGGGGYHVYMMAVVVVVVVMAFFPFDYRLTA